MPCCACAEAHFRSGCWDCATAAFHDRGGDPSGLWTVSAPPRVPLSGCAGRIRSQFSAACGGFTSVFSLVEEMAPQVRIFVESTGTLFILKILVMHYALI